MGIRIYIVNKFLVKFEGLYEGKFENSLEKHGITTYLYLLSNLFINKPVVCIKLEPNKEIQRVSILQKVY